MKKIYILEFQQQRHPINVKSCKIKDTKNGKNEEKWVEIEKYY